MTRDEACEHIAAVMNEWFTTDVSGQPYTAEYIARQLAEMADDEARADESVMWYPAFAMEVLTRAGVLD